MAVKTANESVNVQFRVKAGLKKRAEAVLRELDLSMSDAFRLFLNDIARNQRVPVSLSLHKETNTNQAKEALKYLKEKTNRK